MSAPEPTASPAASPPPVDVEKLADRVYRLMLAELRVELARHGGPTGGK